MLFGEKKFYSCFIVYVGLLFVVGGQVCVVYVLFSSS
jgi:hypothetical protein